ncbi:LrgB family protein, partial [Salmonella enterica]|nr:LrgB family protein [Salmonella enterica]
MNAVFGLWIYLSTTPLFWLTVTLLAWLVADGIARLSGRHPLANAVLIAGAIVGAMLIGSGTSYRTYFDGAQFIHFLLGPATVALGIPLYRNRALVLRNLVPMMAALFAGAVVSIASALLIAASLGA